MNLYAIIFILLIIIGLVLVYRWYIRDKKEIISEWDASKSRSKVIDSDDVKLSTSPNFTFSVWLYIKEWKTSDHAKHVFQRNKGNSTQSITVTDANGKALSNSMNTDSKNVLFHMELGRNVNTLSTFIKLSDDTFAECHIPSIPIQRWVHVLATVQSTMVDMYIDGKLYKNCQFKSAVADIPKETQVVVMGGSAIRGKLSKLEYIRKYIPPQHAWDIYVDGPRDSNILGTWLNRYMLRVQWMKDGVVDKEFKV